MVVAGLFALAAIVHFVIEMTLRHVNPYMPSGVLAVEPDRRLFEMRRSLVSWIRAGQMDHVDLRD